VVFVQGNYAPVGGPSLLVLPDSEELFRVVLGVMLLEVTGDTVPGFTKVPNPRPAEFFVVRRVGGSRRDLVTDVPVLQVEVWAKKESRADRLSQVIRSLMQWFVEVNGFAINGTEEVTAPVSFPDGSQHERYTASYAPAVRGRETIALA